MLYVEANESIIYMACLSQLFAITFMLLDCRNITGGGDRS